MIQAALYFADGVIKNCSDGGTDCFTTLPRVTANNDTVVNALSVLFGVMGAVTVLIIIVQAIRFTMSKGEPDKIAEARRGIIYAFVGLGVSVSAEIIVNFVIGRL